MFYGTRRIYKKAQKHKNVDCSWTSQPISAKLHTKLLPHMILNWWFFQNHQQISYPLFYFCFNCTAFQLYPVSPNDDYINWGERGRRPKINLKSDKRQTTSRKSLRTPRARPALTAGSHETFSNIFVYYLFIILFSFFFGGGIFWNVTRANITAARSLSDWNLSKICKGYFFENSIWFI